MPACRVDPHVLLWNSPGGPRQRGRDQRTDRRRHCRTSGRKGGSSPSLIFNVLMRNKLLNNRFTDRWLVPARCVHRPPRSKLRKRRRRRRGGRRGGSSITGGEGEVNITIKYYVSYIRTYSQVRQCCRDLQKEEEPQLKLLINRRELEVVSTIYLTHTLNHLKIQEFQTRSSGSSH